MVVRSVSCRDTKEQANEYVDIVIPTGMGWARNQLIVNAADAIVSVAGGAGTLSELAYAWQSGKPVVCYTAFEGGPSDWPICRST